MAVSFTLVDLKFLVEQSFSLTLQPPRPTLAKVNKTYEQYRHYNVFFIVLLVRNISKMKLLLSCSSRRQDPRRHRKTLPARGPACIFSPISPIASTGCFAFHLFGAPNQSYLVIIIWSCTSSRQDLKVLIKQRYSLHTQSTSPNVYYGLLDILLFCTPNQSFIPWNHFLQEYNHICFLNLAFYLQLVGS